MLSVAYEGKQTVGWCKSWNQRDWAVSCFFVAAFVSALHKSFTYVSGSFFFERKYKAAAVILISKKLIPNPIQISAKSEQSKTEISKMKHSKNELKDISFFLQTHHFEEDLKMEAEEV